MESLHNLVRISLPNYLKNLPIPDSFAGLFKLNASEIIKLLPFLGIVSFSVYITYKVTCPAANRRSTKTLKCNPSICKEKEKVVDFVEIEEICKKVSYCRCWRSKKFPLCDGSHNAHNKETGDNVGPLVLKVAE
ncbi:DgyrCDS419 [Dimorphilus gyrociliatus]|uniref:CDGSH iron-sulfur domain-containing protein 2 homologue n=1 Tax=Dimorphilus gyrociliatus TaxID=2664684 RepID=A0A7I8V623_9ANNE|nr:DgyrCDS419 [Dimorphilus gyrociliatus]